MDFGGVRIKRQRAPKQIFRLLRSAELKQERAEATPSAGIGGRLLNNVAISLFRLHQLLLSVKRLRHAQHLGRRQPPASRDMGLRRRLACRPAFDRAGRSLRFS